MQEQEFKKNGGKLEIQKDWDKATSESGLKPSWLAFVLIWTSFSYFATSAFWICLHPYHGSLKELDLRSEQLITIADMVWNLSPQIHRLKSQPPQISESVFGDEALKRWSK